MGLHVLNNEENKGEETAMVVDGGPNDPVKKIGRIEVDRELCIGAESCVVVAPEVFEMDDENIAVVKEGYQSDYDTILASAQSCPVAAVILYDEEGKQIYP